MASSFSRGARRAAPAAPDQGGCPSPGRAAAEWRLQEAAEAPAPRQPAGEASSSTSARLIADIRHVLADDGMSATEALGEVCRVFLAHQASLDPAVRFMLAVQEMLDEPAGDTAPARVLTDMERALMAYDVDTAEAQRRRA